MARFRSNKRAKELQRKAKHEAKEARKRDRQERAASGEADDDIDWSQAVGGDPPPGWQPPGEGDGEPEGAVDGGGTGAPRRPAGSPPGRRRGRRRTAATWTTGTTRSRASRPERSAIADCDQ